jgi:hypothetical protein
MHNQPCVDVCKRGNQLQRSSYKETSLWLHTFTVIFTWLHFSGPVCPHLHAQFNSFVNSSRHKANCSCSLDILPSSSMSSNHLYIGYNQTELTGFDKGESDTTILLWGLKSYLESCQVSFPKIELCTVPCPVEFLFPTLLVGYLVKSPRVSTITC